MKKKILPSKEVSRRDLLRLLGMGAGGSVLSSPLMMIAESVIQSSFLRTAAHAQNVKPRKYVYIQMAGAPPRWAYDLFLTPYESGYTEHPHLGTRFAGGSTYTGVDYQTINKNGIQVPPMWGFSVPSRGGGTRPMADLLRNLLHVRGVNMLDPGHATCRAFHFQALAANASVTALTADASSAPLKAINLGCDDYRFTSRANRNFVLLARADSRNLLDVLLSPFISKASSDFVSKANMIGSAINQATASLNTFARSRHPAALQTINAQADANAMLDRNFGNLAVQWTALVNKYEDLIKRSLSTTDVFPGFTDKVVGASSGRGAEYVYFRPVTLPDLKNMIQPTTVVRYMAEHFAVAEYVLLNGISESVSISPAGLNLLNSGSTQFGQIFDEHYGGVMPSLIINFYFYRAFSACLLEFIERLKEARIFDNTVVNVGGDFNRAPSLDGSGSEHATRAASIAIYSGIIKGPMVLGNILKSSASTLYPGTWGAAAGNKIANSNSMFQNGGHLNPGNLNATLAVLLGVPPALQAFGPIVKLDNTGVVPLIERARQV